MRAYGTFNGRFRKQTSRASAPVFMRDSEQNGRSGGFLNKTAV